MRSFLFRSCLASCLASCLVACDEGEECTRRSQPLLLSIEEARAAVHIIPDDPEADGEVQMSGVIRNLGDKDCLVAIYAGRDGSEFDSDPPLEPTDSPTLQTGGTEAWLVTLLPARDGDTVHARELAMSPAIEWIPAGPWTIIRACAEPQLELDATLDGVDCGSGRWSIPAKIEVESP